MSLTLPNNLRVWLLLVITFMWLRVLPLTRLESDSPLGFGFRPNLNATPVVGSTLGGVTINHMRV